MYDGEEYNPSDDELKEYVGFVYMITDRENDMKYIGKKLFWSKRRLPPLKGKTRKRTKIVQSDWKTYHSSSPNIQKLYEEHGSERFSRVIIRLCRSKGECSYYEAKLQFDNDVLLRDDFYNGIINCRINASHLKKL